MRQSIIPLTTKNTKVCTKSTKLHVSPYFGISFPVIAFPCAFAQSFLVSFVVGFFLLLAAPTSLYARCVSGDCQSGNGTYVWENGSTYTGFFERGKMNGTGTYVWSDGSNYTGGWKNASKEGNGTYEWKNGDRYKGEWLNNKKSGKGIFIESNGQKYDGSWLNDVKSGYGIYFWKNDDYYEGEWKDDLRSGQGNFTSGTGNRYEGQWLNGLMHGTGRYQWKNGEVYKGEWVRGEREGSGIQTLSNGDRYAGEWKAGKMDGYGVFVWKNGAVYAGNWKKSEMFGNGDYTSIAELKEKRPGYLEKLFNEGSSSRTERLVPMNRDPKPLENGKPIPLAVDTVKELPMTNQEEERFLKSLDEQPNAPRIDVRNLEVDHTYQVAQKTPLLAERTRNGDVVKTVVYLDSGETFTVLRRKESKSVVLYSVIFRDGNKGWINSITLNEKKLKRIGLE